MIIRIVIALLVFGIIIVIHELGHFMLAKKNGIGVIEFAVGMGPKVVSREKNGTVYSIRLFPIGGFCNMVGEDDDSQDESAFNNKSVWARISVIAAGPIFNFILAFVFAIFIIGTAGHTNNEVNGVTENSAAHEAGIKAGDRITKINNTKIVIFQEISLTVQLHQGETLSVEYIRDGVKNVVDIVPKKDEKTGRYFLGVQGGQRHKGNAFQTIGYSAYEVKYWISTTLKSLGMMVQGKVSKNDIAGPVGIVDMIGSTYETAKQDGLLVVLLSLANMTILLSANLGVINLLPLPALDGGRLVFLFIEAIRGKPLNREKEGQVHFIGLVLLMILMIFIVFNDVSRIIK